MSCAGDENRHENLCAHDCQRLHHLTTVNCLNSWSIHLGSNLMRSCTRVNANLLLSLQASRFSGSNDAASRELLAQLLPIFSCAAEERRAFGSTLPAGSEAPAAGEPVQSGYWDLVYILYPELLERLGAQVLRELVPTWPLLERTLEVISRSLTSSLNPATLDGSLSGLNHVQISSTALKI